MFVPRVFMYLSPRVKCDCFYHVHAVYFHADLTVLDCSIALVTNGVPDCQCRAFTAVICRVQGHKCDIRISDRYKC